MFRLTGPLLLFLYYYYYIFFKRSGSKISAKDSCRVEGLGQVRPLLLRAKEGNRSIFHPIHSLSFQCNLSKIQNGILAKEKNLPSLFESINLILMGRRPSV